jgi:hypothetical protein
VGLSAKGILAGISELAICLLLTKERTELAKPKCHSARRHCTCVFFVYYKEKFHSAVCISNVSSPNGF